MNILEYTFFQNALAGAFLASILCGFIGTYIVTRRGMKPGVRKQQMMPTLMPRVQNMAMAES